MVHMRNYMNKYVFIIIAAILATTIHSCNTNNGYTETRKRIVSHYLYNDPDTQKLMAARFLFNNMHNKYSVIPSSADHYEKLFATISHMRSEDGKLTHRAVDAINSIRNRDKGNYRVSYDSSTISSDFLISEIDAAFEQWRSAPWSKEYSFDDFCRWVLPYRIANEKLDKWRHYALSFHRPQEDSLKAIGDMWELGRLLINTSGINYSEDIYLPFHLTFKQMSMIKDADCNAMSYYATMLLRSRGIPTSTESTPAWGNRSSKHSWNAIITSKGTPLPISFYGDNSAYVFADHRLSKIYRHCYHTAKETVPFRYRDRESFPPYFSNADKIDVTSQYDMQTIDITIDKLDSTISKIAWLCTFNNNEWIPVACAEITDGKALFRDMGNGRGFNHDAFKFEGGDLGIVYLPAYYIKGKTLPASAPVLVKEDGSVKTLVPDTNILQSITTKRKYPLFSKFYVDRINMTGACFEASDNMYFNDAVTLLTIDSLQPHPLTPYKTNHPDKKFRYVRCRFSDKSPDLIYNVCQVRFYSNGNLLVGKTIYNTEMGNIENPDNLFDNNMLTYCKAEKSPNTWVGLDLGTPRNISSIEYMARTDDNDIWPGDEYEMFYWNNGWQSAGRKTASEYKLTWHNLPSGTLYLVIDRTKGVENRIFTYDDHTIRWW